MRAGLLLALGGAILLLVAGAILAPVSGGDLSGSGSVRLAGHLRVPMRSGNSLSVHRLGQRLAAVAADLRSGGRAHSGTPAKEEVGEGVHLRFTGGAPASSGRNGGPTDVGTGGTGGSTDSSTTGSGTSPPTGTGTSPTTSSTTVAQDPQGSNDTAAAPQTVTGPTGYGCAAAVSYLLRYANPAFSIECPAWAGGHQAMTCDDVPGACSGQLVIVIADPCPAAYQNEAWNSWHLSTGPIDPFGECSY